MLLKISCPAMFILFESFYNMHVTGIERYFSIKVFSKL